MFSVTLLLFMCNITCIVSVGGDTVVPPQTLYRPSELSEWRKFDHPNVTALLMVTGLEPGNYCCQFMTLMDGMCLL